MSAGTMARVALAGVVILGVGYAGLQLAGQAASSSNELAKARKYKLQDGRAVVVLQLCWYPNDRARVSVGWSLGGGGDIDHVGPPLTCGTPWQRKAVLDPGARVALGWTLATGPVSKFKYRISVNNRPRIEGDETANTRMYACIVGMPPCEIP